MTHDTKSAQILQKHNMLNTGIKFSLPVISTSDLSQLMHLTHDVRLYIMELAFDSFIAYH